MTPVERQPETTQDEVEQDVRRQRHEDDTEMLRREALYEEREEARQSEEDER